MTTEPTIAAGFAKAFLDFAVRKGANRRQLLKQRALVQTTSMRRTTMFRSQLHDADENRDRGVWRTGAGSARLVKAVRLQTFPFGLVDICETATEARIKPTCFGRLAVDDGNGDTSHGVEFIREGRNVWLTFQVRSIKRIRVHGIGVHALRP